jgi:uncharacterized protein (TIGR02246 family)
MKPMVAVAMAALVVSGCVGRAQPAGGGNSSGAGVDAIMNADRDFNTAVSDRDLARFLSFIAEGATFNGGTPGEIRGRDAIAKDWAPFFDAAGPRLTWAPTHAEVLGAGDLGYSVGSSEYRTAPAGGQTTRRGQYLTVWRKQADGAWKVVSDSGSNF